MSGLNGAEKVYKSVILPWYKKNQSKLDKAVGNVKKAATEFVGDNKDVLNKAANMAIAAADTSVGEEIKKDS